MVDFEWFDYGLWEGWEDDCVYVDEVGCGWCGDGYGEFGFVWGVVWGYFVSLEGEDIECVLWWKDCGVGSDGCCCLRIRCVECGFGDLLWDIKWFGDVCVLDWMDRLCG